MDINKYITLIHGDCLVKMQDIKDNSIDCIICDLPYEVLNRNNKHAQWDRMIPLTELWYQYTRITKPNSAIVLFSQGMFTVKLMQSNPEMWRYNLIWDKVNRPTGFLNANRMPLRIHEDICVFYDKQPVYNPQFSIGRFNHKRGGAGNGLSYAKNGCYGDFKRTEVTLTNEKYPTSILSFEKEHASGKFLHPTQKPVALIEYLIKTYSNEGDLILDNTAGSMTTAIAAINTNRRCICIEKDDHYFEVGSDRVKQHLSSIQLKLF